MSEVRVPYNGLHHYPISQSCGSGPIHNIMVRASLNVHIRMEENLISVTMKIGRTSGVPNKEDSEYMCKYGITILKLVDI